MTKRRSRRVSVAAKARRKRAVLEWVERNGLVCPGHRRAAHTVRSVRDLTADHVTPLAAGGRESGLLRVLCRSCNSRRSRKGATGRLDRPTRNRTQRSFLD